MGIRVLGRKQLGARMGMERGESEGERIFALPRDSGRGPIAAAASSQVFWSPLSCMLEFRSANQSAGEEFQILPFLSKGASTFASQGDLFCTVQTAATPLMY